MTMFENFFWPPGHPQRPKVPPLGHDPGDRMNIPSDMFLSFICDNTHKVWYKNLWSWLCNWNQIIFGLLTPLQGPRGQGQKKFDVACHVSNSHTEIWIGWISPNGLGGDSITNRQTDGLTDRQTEAITISPSLFYKSVGITKELWAGREIYSFGLQVSSRGIRVICFGGEPKLMLHDMHVCRNIILLHCR